MPQPYGSGKDKTDTEGGACPNGTGNSTIPVKTNAPMVLTDVGNNLVHKTIGSKKVLPLAMMPCKLDLVLEK